MGAFDGDYVPEIFDATWKTRLISTTGEGSDAEIAGK